jgi:hypothetical protein
MVVAMQTQIIQKCMPHWMLVGFVDAARLASLRQKCRVAVLLASDRTPLEICFGHTFLTEGGDGI